MKTYTIARADGSVPLTGAVDGPWCEVKPAVIDEFNWYESGRRPVTTVRGLYDDEAL